MTNEAHETGGLLPDGLLRDGPDGPDTSGFGLLDLFTARYDVLARLLDRESKQLLDTEFGISLVEWRILSALSVRGGMTIGDLAKMSGFDKSQISRAATLLENAGSIGRVDSPSDGRSAIIDLTDDGRDRYDRMIPVVRERNRRLLSLFAPAEREQAYRMIDTLTTYLRDRMDRP